jgi:hypothetical protein
VTIGDYIKQCFSPLGDISDAGVEKFALGLRIDPSSDVDISTKVKISGSVDKFMDKILTHPTSVSENGFSKSWGADTLLNYAKYMFKMYGITPNDDTAALVGISIIKDASNIW